MFHSDYSGYQASQIGAALGGAAGVFNVGSATINGVEGQFVAAVENIGRFNVNAAFLQTYFGEGITVFDGQSTPEPHNISGNQLPNAPPWVLTAGFEHTFDLGDYGQLTGRFDGKYSSHYYFDVFNFPDTRQDSFFTGNLSATYTPAKGKWRLEGFVYNFTNAVTFANATRNWNVNYNSYEFNPPLTFGARVHYAF
jgi:iron complex outermembrane receptor protein